MGKPKLPRLFHLLKQCPEHAWIDGVQATSIEFRDDNTVWISDLENNDYVFADQDVDLVDGYGSAKATDGYECAVDFEVPVPIRVTNENWEEFLPLKGPQ